MADIEIGRGKTGRRAYALDEIGIVPARRTRDPEEVSIAWQIDAYRFDLPLVACPMDSVVSPATAITIGKLGGLAVLDLEGLWTRFNDPEPLLAEVAELDEDAATTRLQEIYAEPIKEELIGRRIEEISPGRRDHRGAAVAAADRPLLQGGRRRGRGHLRHPGHHGVGGARVRPRRAPEPEAVHLRAGHSGHRGRLCHLHGRAAPDAHRRGRRPRRASAAESGHTTAAVLGVAVPMASAIADVAAARRDYLDESGGRYVHVVADGSMTRSGDIAKALALGSDAVMVGSPLARAEQAPGRGYHWGSEANHPELPRGARVHVGTIGTMEQILHGPSTVPDGSMNLMGALRRTMATAGYTDLKEFQRVEVVVTPPGTRSR